MMSAGWVRVGLAVVVLVAVAAIGVWYKQRASERATSGPAAASSPGEKTQKPASRPAGDPRDAPRERPERNRTDRP